MHLFLQHFLWLIVANVANPVTKSTYTNIKVTIANDDVITQGGEVYTVLDDQNVNVVVYAKTFSDSTD